MAVDPAIAHLVPRAGFGYSPAEGAMFNQMSLPGAIDALVDYEQVPDTVDDNTGIPGFLGTTAAGEDGPLLAYPLRDRVQQDRRSDRVCRPASRST